MERRVVDGSVEVEERARVSLLCASEIGYLLLYTFRAVSILSLRFQRRRKLGDASRFLSLPRELVQLQLRQIGTVPLCIHPHISFIADRAADLSLFLREEAKRETHDGPPSSSLDCSKL